MILTEAMKEQLSDIGFLDSDILDIESALASDDPTDDVLMNMGFDDADIGDIQEIVEYVA